MRARREFALGYPGSASTEPYEAKQAGKNRVVLGVAE
jgi:hypothetical protein